ncbi:MAG: hypothetical protein WDM96_19470 [Lacunisphaera sp.]
MVEADQGGKVKTFAQLNAIGWLMGARMFQSDYGDLFLGDDMAVRIVHWMGIGWYVLSAILTITSGISYFRKHGYVVLE